MVARSIYHLFHPPFFDLKFYSEGSLESLVLVLVAPNRKSIDDFLGVFEEQDLNSSHGNMK